VCVYNNCILCLDSVLQQRKLEYLANTGYVLVAGVGAGSKYTFFLFHSLDSQKQGNNFQNDIGSLQELIVKCIHTFYFYKICKSKSYCSY